MIEKIYDFAFIVDNNPTLEAWVFSNTELEMFSGMVILDVIEEFRVAALNSNMNEKEIEALVNQVRSVYKV